VKSHASEASSPGGIQHSEPMGLGVAGPTLGNLSLDHLCVRIAGISSHFADQYAGARGGTDDSLMSNSLCRRLPDEGSASPRSGWVQTW
jgi:hypothetical protein